MDSDLLLHIHTISVMAFLATYVIKTLLLFTSKPALEKYARITKVPEMIISLTFLATGIWLFVIIGGIKSMQILKLALVFISIPVAIIGFKKHKKFLALLSLILIIGAYGVAEISKGKPFIPARTEASNPDNSEHSAGAVIYHSNCVFCHGNDGKKKYRGATDLTLSQLNEDAIKQFVVQGSKGKMPSYIAVIQNEADLDALSKFVKNLQPSPIAQ